MAKGKKANSLASQGVINISDSLKATKIEGSIIKLIDYVAQKKANYSIAHTQIFTNETPLVVVDKYTPQLTTLKQLRDYFGVNGKTYKMTANMFSQGNNITANPDYSLQYNPINFTEATPSKVISVEYNVSMLKSISNGGLRLKWEGRTTTPQTLQSTSLKEAIKEFFTIANNQYATLYVVDNSFYATKDITSSCFDTYICIVETNDFGKIIRRYIEKVNLIGKDVVDKYVLFNDNGVYKFQANNTHYKEVVKLNFTGCDTKDDIVKIFNDAGFNAVFNDVDNKLVISTKAVGNQIKLEVENILDTSATDLKNILFTEDTPAQISTNNNIDTTAFDAVSDGILTIQIGSAEANLATYELTQLDFTQSTPNTVETIKEVIKAKATSLSVGANFTQSQGVITIKTIETGSGATINVVPYSGGETGTDLTNSLLTFGAPASGSDGYSTQIGTNASGDDIIELYNQYNDNADYNGDVLTTTLSLDIDYLFNLNQKLVSNIAEGNRVIFLHTIEDPYMLERTSHGALLDWLRTDLMGLYTGDIIDIANLEARGAVLSISLSQNCVSNDRVLGEKNDMHLKDISVPSMDVNKGIDNDTLDLVTNNGCGAISYYKDGLGLKMTNPRTTANTYTWSDAVNLQNLYKTSIIALANFQATNKHTNKTNDEVNLAKEVLYNIFTTASTNGVLTGTVSDFSNITTNVEEAKNQIINSASHSYIYNPDVRTVQGDIIPLTIYLGFAQSIYGFTLQFITMR